MAGVHYRAERQFQLKTQYYLDCKCKLCEVEEEVDIADYSKLSTYFTLFTKGRMCTADQLIKEIEDIAAMTNIFSQYDERVTDVYIKQLKKYFLPRWY